MTDLSLPGPISLRRRFRTAVSRENTTALLMLLPSLVLLILVIAYPMARGFVYTLYDGSLLATGRFVGLGNYYKLFMDPAFWHAASFSFLFAICNIFGCYTIGLGFALLLNKDFPGRGIVRVLLLLPWTIPSLVAVVSWRWMVADQDALINRIVTAFGADPILFLSNGSWTIVVVIVVKIWASFPFMMLSLLAALQSVDRTLYEAAKIDGASSWHAFRYVTFPGIRSVSVVLCLLMAIWTVNDFDTPWLLARGGPADATQNLVVMAYRYTFARNNVGMGATISFVTLFALMALFALVLRATRRSSDAK